MSTSSVTVGAAVISMRVSVEAEGVQIDVRHVSGGTARLAILLPESNDFAFGNEYVDWYRQDDMRVPHAFEVKPGEEEHTIYGRFETARTRRFTSVLPHALPAQLEHGGLSFVTDDGDARPLVDAAARAISAVLGIPCSVRASGSAGGWSGITVDLVAPRERAARLASLASAVERFMLAGERPR